MQAFGWSGRSGSRRRLLLLPVCVYLAVFYVIPIGSFLALSISGPNGPTMAVFAQIGDRPDVARSIVTSLKTALVTTVLALALSYPLAHYLTTLSGRSLGFAVSLVVLSLLTSILVRTYAWIALLGRVGVINSVLLETQLTQSPLDLIFNTTGVYIGLVHVLLPFSVLPIYSVMRGVDRNLLRAAESLGASPMGVFVRVYFPLTLPGVTSGALLVFIAAVGAYVTPVLLGGPRDLMIANLIGNEVELTLNWPLAAALSIIMLGVTLGVLVAYFWLNRSADRALIGTG